MFIHLFFVHMNFLLTIIHLKVTLLIPYSGFCLALHLCTTPLIRSVLQSVLESESQALLQTDTKSVLESNLQSIYSSKLNPFYSPILSPFCSPIHNQIPLSSSQAVPAVYRKSSFPFLWLVGFSWPFHPWRKRERIALRAWITKNIDRSTWPLACPFTHLFTAHSFTCSAVLALLARSAALTHLLTLLTPSLVGKWMVIWLFFCVFCSILDHSALAAVALLISTSDLWFLVR